MLAIILLIATPIILNVINDARIGAFASSKKNIERAAELYYASNSGKVKFENEISYIEIGTLIEEGYLKEGVTNALTKSKLDASTKVLIYKSGRNIEFSLQMHDEIFLNWYKEEMIKAAKKLKKEPIEDSIEVSLEELMNSKEVSELRLPLDLDQRCVGYVEITKENNKNEYQAYVDCLTEASSFASHYVSYGGKYLDEFNDVKETSDGGFIAVGRSNSEVITKYGTGNNGKYDAIIVKFNSKGEVEWSRNFGGSNDDRFYAVAEVPDGYVAVGSTSSNAGDIEDYKGGLNDAVIVKYNYSGEVLNKRNYGGTNTSNTDSFNNILIDNGKLIIVGDANLSTLDGDYKNVIYEGNHMQFVFLVMDLNFNIINQNFYDAQGYQNLKKIIKTNDGYIAVGTYSTSTLSPILKLNNDLKVISKFEFTGANSSRGSFNDVVEVNDGYIVVGNFNGSGENMTGLSKANNGYHDAVIVKYDKNLGNIIWKRSFGGSNDDIFYSIINSINEEVIVVGYSKSNDMDMNGISISDEGYRNAILITYNSVNGNIVNKTVFGGTNSDVFNTIIKTTNNKYVVAGNSFSTDINLKNFNKGHGDALLIAYDFNLNLAKIFQEPVVLIEKLKKITPNYGTDTNSKYEKIYTSNNPEKDLDNWCSASYSSGQNNYDYGQCLKPFNTDDMRLLNNIENTPNFKIINSGEQEYIIDEEPTNKTNWYQLYFRMQGGSTELSSFKIKFENGYIGSIEESINNNYLEPLVIVSNALTVSPYTERTYNNLLNILKTDGKIDGSIYPVFYMNLKSKKEKIESFIFTSNRNVTGTDRGLSIYELRNFDMSITPTN